MPVLETLMLAVTKMLGGVCIAGMTTQPDPITGLQWLRPVREFGHILLGDITTTERHVLRPFDVVEFHCLRPCPSPPHTEDWVTDFVQCRPRVVRRLSSERRAAFLERYLDTAPAQVLEKQQRSLCLIKPDWIRGCFRLDSYSGRFDARLAFGLGARRYLGSYAKGGVSVTDIKWRALGRHWVCPQVGGIDFDAGDLEAQFGIERVYLAVGLTRSFRGGHWPVIVGVHTWPDYEATIDYDNL
jgi:hypothetical protein